MQSMEQHFFRELDTPSQPADGLSILQRSLDGLGFRLYWAVNGMREDDYASRPSPDSMSIEELCAHISHLVKFIGELLDCPVSVQSDLSNVERDIQSLNNLEHIRNEVLSKDLSVLHQKDNFWNLFNGPLADALSHTGQLNSWRRINGNPIGKVSFFSGKAAKAK